MLAPLPAELAQAPCLSDDEVRYICRQAAAIEAAEGTPQDVEWAIARGLGFPDGVFFLQHRPETTWAAATPTPAAPAATPRSRRGASIRCSTRCATCSRCPARDLVPGGAATGPAEVRLAVAAARAGGAVLMKRLRAGADLEVGYKDARANLVTAADREAQRAVTAMILAAFPRHAGQRRGGHRGKPRRQSRLVRRSARRHDQLRARGAVLLRVGGAAGRTATDGGRARSTIRCTTSCTQRGPRAARR